MSAIESISQDLRLLPPKQQNEVASAVNKLKEEWFAKRNQAFEELANSMSKEEAEAFEQAINEQFERIDD